MDWSIQYIMVLQYIININKNCPKKDFKKASHISHLSFWHDSNACKILIILRSIWINIISQQFNNYYSLFFVNTFHFLVMLYWLINNNLHFFIVPLQLYFLMGGFRKSTNSVLSLRECKWFHSNHWLKAVLVIA